ncbi:hypothetical protein [Campylobacter concisus]|nr:hypothetical protein [Campylobacter concisus]
MIQSYLKLQTAQTQPRHSFNALAHAGEISKIAKTGFTTYPITTK